MINSEIDRISILTASEKDKLDLSFDYNWNYIRKPSTTEKNIENALKCNYLCDDDKFEYGDFGIEDNNDSISKSFISFISKKTERNDNDNYIDNIINIQTNEKKKKIFDVKKDIKVNTIEYRHDYYIMEFKTVLLKFLQKKLNDLIIKEIKPCPKFGKRKIYTPNRKLYGGNPTTEANKEFINKTVEKIFTDQGNQGDEEIKDEINLNEDEDTNRQKDNEIIFNKIKNGICLNKSDNSEKYKKQSEAVKKFTTYLNKTIKEILKEDEFNNSDEFGEFRSDQKILKYDYKFTKERNRNLSLLENYYNFVILIEKDLL